LSDRYSFCGKRPLAIVAMNTELLPFKNGEHNSESESTLDRYITPLKAFKSRTVRRLRGVETLYYVGTLAASRHY